MDRLKAAWGYVTAAHEDIVETIAMYPTVTLWLGVSLILAAIIIF